MRSRLLRRKTPERLPAVRAEPQAYAIPLQERAFAERMMDGYCQVDLSGRVLGSNSAFRTLLEYSPEDLMLLTLKHLTPEKWRELDDEMIHRHLDPDGKTPLYAKELLTKNGLAIPVLVQWYLDRDNFGRPVGTSFVVRDTRPSAEEKQRTDALKADLVERLREQTQELSAANKELESFVHTVSHDLRVPLHGLLGWGQALLEDCGSELGEVGRRHVDQLKSQVNQLATLLDGLLALARLARSTIHRDSINLSALSEEVWTTLQASAPERQVEKVLEPEMSLTADPVLMRIVMHNLLENAWKFTKDRNVARIEIGRRKDGNESVYFVRDNGAGFSMNRSHKLFLPFQRLHRQGDFPGTGLGLATVRKALQRQGGRIWAESTEGHGATFFFTL